MSSATQNIDVILRGGTQAGKTTALAAYLCHDPSKPEWVDRLASETVDTMRFLRTKYWNRLMRNQLPEGTMKPEFLTLKHRDGHLIRFRDMKGGDAEDLSPEDTKALLEAQAVMICVEWPSQRIISNNLAYENARQFTQRSYAMVITKVECYLALEQVLHFTQDPIGMAKKMKVGESFIRLLENTPLNRVFPISVYGYSAGKFPAHYRDEFGRLLPQNIRPYGVNAPFDYVLKQIC